MCPIDRVTIEKDNGFIRTSGDGGSVLWKPITTEKDPGWGRPNFKRSET